ncbi:MAG TPA: hypothetical protein VMV97_07745 [Sulfuriferula sp.]|nr:hypothetical protein [Sulfuriferula sp.]
MKSITSTIVAGVLLAAASFANAEPVALSDTQMDQVSAGATALAGAGAISFGDLISATGAYTRTAAVAPGFASASAISGAIAASLYYGAAAQSVAVATASLP